MKVAQFLDRRADLPQALVVIPARWGSSRFPGKVLASLNGKPLVLHACECARRAERVERVVVATDDTRILEAVKGAGHEAELTAPEHPSGTDRVAEVARRHEAEIVLGLQADEPFLEARDLDALVAALADPRGQSSLATLSFPIASLRDFQDPNVVKVVTDPEGRALYFSRSPIPYERPAKGLPAFPPAEVPGSARVHVGVYGWRRDALEDFVSRPPSALEELEGLEQLRALEAGWTIRVLPASGEPFGVDTPEDLRRAEARFRRETGKATE
jgi:3-deoxy-manno-octulosonate cytidylyltransferase (CMP-KDO synthetase)